MILAGCGGDPYGDYQKEYDRISCEALFRCCGAGASAHDPKQPDEASCVAALDARIGSSTRTAVAKGFLRFDAAAARRCLDGTRAALAECGAKLDRGALPIADCAVVLTGTGATGKDCALDLDCVAGDHCQAGTPAGTCQPLVASGQPCSGPCAAGLVCQPIPYLCGPMLDEFQICETDSQCKSASCRPPCAVPGEADFCPKGCTRDGLCPIDCGMVMPCLSAALRCAPLPTVQKALCGGS